MRPNRVRRGSSGPVSFGIPLERVRQVGATDTFRPGTRLCLIGILYRIASMVRPGAGKEATEEPPE